MGFRRLVAAVSMVMIVLLSALGTMPVAAALSVSGATGASPAVLTASPAGAPATPSAPSSASPPAPSSASPPASTSAPSSAPPTGEPSPASPASPGASTDPSGSTNEPAEPEADPEPDPEPGPQPESSAATARSQGTLKTEQSGTPFAPAAIGTPDGGTAPYVHWTVTDENGIRVPGATFTFEYRAWNLLSWNWTSGSNANPLADTVTAPAGTNSIDRDTDGGEFLLEHRATARNSTTRLKTSENYRVTPAAPPAGYAWVDTDARSINGDSNIANWSANGGRHDVGTFRVRKLQSGLQCQAGYVYGLTGNGQLREVRPDGTVASIGSRASGVSSLNGLGVGSGGSPVFAYERNSAGSEITLWRYNTDTGAWTSAGHSINSTTNSRTVVFVAGAVSLQNGRYYVGGFNSTGTRFRLWEYNPATNASVYKGEVNTSSGASETSNGDIAFDATGNLFIIRGSGNQTTVFSVTAADVAAGSGGTIPGSVSRTVTTMSNVNGVAFDAGGRVFLGAGSELRSWAMPNWTDERRVTSAIGTGTTTGTTSTDLSTCSSPPTITIEKYVEGQRVKPGDQFRLSLTQGTSTIGEATTTGMANGLQAARVGPLPTVRGVPLRFSESAAGTTNLSDYVTSRRCEVDGVLDPTASGTGTEGSITIPTSARSVVCRFHNSPLISPVSITKTVFDFEGENARPGEDWTVDAAARATAGGITSAPTATTQRTNADGEAAWNLRFTTRESRATLTVSETQQAGYEFVSGECVVTSLDGSERLVELTGENGQGIPGIAPGDRVDCDYVNKVAGASLTLAKDVDARYDPDAGADQWVLSARGPTTGISGITGAEAVTEATVAPGRYALSEALAPDFAAKADGYRPVRLVCTDQDSGTMTSVSVDNPHLELGADTEVECVFTNRDLPGSTEWFKVDGGTGDALAGSAWTLTGPSHPGGLALTDGGEGGFFVGDLAWGEYELVEARAPTGYRRSDEVHEFTVGPGSPAGLAVDLGPLENEQQEPLVIPQTGGQGSHLYWIGGGLLTALAVAIGLWKARRGGARHV